MATIKCVAVGDCGVGKTCLLVTFCTGQFPGEYIPMISLDWEVIVKVNDTHVSFKPWDTASHQDYDTVRPLSYPETSVFLLCFSLENQASFYKIEQKWYPEVRHHCPDTPVVLVGTKLDIREEILAMTTEQTENISTFISYKQGLSLANKLSVKYVECSAKTQQGLKNAIDVAINSVIIGRKSKHSMKPQHKCRLL